MLVKFPPTAIAVEVCDSAAPPLINSAPEPSAITPAFEVVPLLMRPDDSSRQELASVLLELTVTVLATASRPAFVSEPLIVSGPTAVISPWLVTVLPFRFNAPRMSIVPRLVTTAAGPSAKPGVRTTIVPVARLITVAVPLVLIEPRNVTVPSLSNSAPDAAASDGRLATPRTNSRENPLRFAGL